MYRFRIGEKNEKQRKHKTQRYGSNHFVITHFRLSFVLLAARVYLELSGIGF
jgi:hypothetical protein